MSHGNYSTYVEWMWQSNPNPYSTTEPEEWSTYSEEPSGIIEEAYQNGDHYAYLEDYTIDLEERYQISNKNRTRRRPIKRVEHNKESWLQRIRKLGRGGFGIVYEGIYRGSRQVAYKVTQSHLSPEAMTETNILKTLSHPNIVRYIDVIHTSKHTLLVMELVDGGTLFNYIQERPFSNKYWNECQKMMIDVAYALTYLQEKNIVHADLKSDNILLRSDNIAVLSDFGLSKIVKDSSMKHSYTDTGAIRWLSPELCTRVRVICSPLSDVWAYGCVLLEIITKKLPWDELFLSNEELMRALSDESNARLFQNCCYNQKAPDHFHKMLRACCTWSKNNRPSFAKIIRDFHPTTIPDDQSQIRRSVSNDETDVTHSQWQSSTRNRPQTSMGIRNSQRKSLPLNRALYDLEDDDNYTLSSSSSSKPYYPTQTTYSKNASMKRPSTSYRCDDDDDDYF
ncbi:hypothetical protein I4U23_023090 [Adineta vaga]|nr:hypothetical protein I4U23_023090 [Adineta vaga]